ncbi:bifunctional tRNA (5-methylaminomethyl-2-thiouridine)(34)-methyltransferase MnmD/FAD-dependent 5-carboxymethylaminomethyl-2-thiouridine(34) oxidoreductase MnmC [Halomonas sp. FeN2]|uniref:bifunctional tRNA (5-methylaminomethyl-2-thiouridine)(34)-methyltransferase MnmD/FAD-dependent 5-carboxymethylaminomethyl-2-thiouridine(34) oxidoreductase MnmC n=1 Tax=Halomonas sp. FeN2 TaxID=2832500 RepID=UPI000C571DCF|nr:MULTISPECIES: bifunctional tRNA (5-methylaminomethyl-2-thiouridine)(34)-methyltransferase MnmD/FAD-dependent 5-carboxymethylaminomethyl-2-thiouridine(34) oxidoreductase MnmC [unclassified Halomonas]MBF56135.1 bifunctional tRNA (5-methylaminomethyl-2-thiouridine)(34)-methyltransferase MnmD/FAD-dependent 5-carboxymethylaminomethyl-2-thiouridine(34) oxidoreductase MnmC [Halomonas sp.]UBR48731.1 bifunctional tRNA (5-methylaminomethyl-2-thiouridine)(34)-methyltransferase MnmD/FAD-dependent 5-carbox
MTQRSNALPPLATLTTPTLTWNEGAPHATAFDDIYFTRGDGRAETEHVFLGANQLPERFAAWEAARPFVIGETGFGTGLNMLCAWACFEQHAPPSARLHLLSTEKFPLDLAALEQALASWPSLATYTQALCAQWPAAVSGIHRLHLTDRVTLDLHFGDTTERLEQLDGQVDAWFLDGFAPSKNPDMWQPELFNAMAARSRPGATFATFTCAGIVKRGLKAAGFSWKKVPGYGRKREMLAGSIETPPADQRRQATPWFTPPPAAPAKHVVIVGAGLAGSSVAAALARRGVKVTVLEREAPGAGGSGNRQGALYVKLAAETNHQSRVYLAGLLYSQRWLAQQHANQTLWQPCGVVQLASSDKEARRQQRFIEQHPLPPEVVTGMDNPTLTETAAITVSAPHGLYYPQAGWVRPKALCEHLLSQPGISLQQGEISSLTQRETGWQLNLADGSTLEADQVVIASAHLANRFAQTAELPLQSVRGQISELTLPDAVEGPKRVVCAGGYVAPALDGVLTFGASFVPNNATTDVTNDDHQRNIDELRQTLPALVEELEQAGIELTPEHLKGRAAVRAASPDKTPYAGQVPVAEAWRTDYSLLSKDATRVAETPGRHYPGLWISTAHGSRGLASAPLCAEVIASRICDEPMPLEAPLVDHLHPGRRIISAIIRGENA